MIAFSGRQLGGELLATFDRTAARLLSEAGESVLLRWVEASEPLLEQAASLKARHSLAGRCLDRCGGAGWSWPSRCEASGSAETPQQTRLVSTPAPAGATDLKASKICTLCTDFQTHPSNPARNFAGGLAQRSSSALPWIWPRCEKSIGRP